MPSFLSIAFLLVCVPTGLRAQGSDIAAGRKEFEARCASCHGADGAGGERARSIRARGRTASQLTESIVRGVPAAGMPAFALPQDSLRNMVAFLLSLGPVEDRSRAAPPPRPISFAEIVDPRPGEWPTYHGQFNGNRHSPLSQINAATVAGLRMQWMFTISGASRLEVTPVVVGNTMYVTSVNEVEALDATTGRLYWQYKQPRTKGLIGDASGGINRGVAVLGNRLFVVTDHAHLLALDRANGALLWDTEMADYREHYGATSAPLVVGDLVISGTSGGDEGVRGFVAAFKAGTGERAWRFWTAPAPGEPAASTWKGRAIEHPCTSAWLSGTYDAKADLLYWTAGNPCPDFNGDERQGDNLYSDSVLALKPATGELRWYYQFTPHDLHDWDAQQTALLADVNFRGKPRSLLLQASRNGFFYVLDRLDGSFLSATPFVRKLTWASGIGRDGRPQLLPGAEPTREGVRVCPAVEGATNWMSTAFDPAMRLFYVMALEKCNVYTKSDAWWEPGKSFYGGGTRTIPGEPGQKYLRAIEIETGKIAWELPQNGLANTLGGVLSTAGGIVFYGDDGGAFAAVAARTGKPLWRFAANQNWRASPMTYAVNGKQYVAIAGGPNVMVFALP